METINDAADYKQVQAALRSINTFNPESIDAIHRILAAILHLGNIEFVDTPENENSDIRNSADLELAAKLLQVDFHTLKQALCSRVVAARGEVKI